MVVMRRHALATLVVWLVVWLAAPAAAAAELAAGGTARVVEVVDGDTVVLDTGERVRMVGIQAPQPNFSLKDSALGQQMARIATRLPPNHSDRAFFSASSVRMAASCSMPGNRCA
jgi:hypothetical protein